MRFVPVVVGWMLNENDEKCERKSKQRDKQNPDRKKRRSNVEYDVISEDEMIESE